jgi:hypothetical protein
MIERKYTHVSSEGHHGLAQMPRNAIVWLIRFDSANQYRLSYLPGLGRDYHLNGELLAASHSSFAMLGPGLIFRSIQHAMATTSACGTFLI